MGNGGNEPGWAVVRSSWVGSPPVIVTPAIVALRVMNITLRMVAVTVRKYLDLRRLADHGLTSGGQILHTARADWPHTPHRYPAAQRPRPDRTCDGFADRGALRDDLREQPVAVDRRHASDAEARPADVRSFAGVESAEESQPWRIDYACTPGAPC
jgi:hypothetical protein